MNLITSEEIVNLYRKCGLDPEKNYTIRHTINTGTLNNRLATNLNFGHVPSQPKKTKQAATIFENNEYRNVR